MLDSLPEPTHTPAPVADPVGRVPLDRFVFVMKALSAGGLWDEVETYLRDHGHAAIPIGREPLALVQELLRAKVARGETIGRGAERFMGSISCFGGHPTPPPRAPSPPSPPDGGGGGGDGGGGGVDGGGGGDGGGEQQQ